MSKPKEPAYVSETLAWCNERRKEKGKKPLKKLPKGMRYQADSCPCGKASGVRVFSDGYCSVGDWLAMRRKRPVPKPVQCFISEFDTGQLPQYDASL